MKVALIGSVSSSFRVLRAMIESGVEAACVAGLDRSLADKIGDFRDLAPLAEPAGIPYIPFRKVAEPQVSAALEEHRPDLLFVVGLSQLVPESLINLARCGGVGFHPTMLPKGRGRAPVAWTILLGEPAAATLFFLTNEPDAGDIIAQREVEVRPDDYSEDLIERTNVVLEGLIHELAPAIKSGNLPRTPQDHARATYYPRRTPADGLIDWRRSTDAIYRLIRAAGWPYHGAFTFLGGRKIILWRARPVKEALPAQQWHTGRKPAEFVRSDDGSLVVATADGLLRVEELESEPDSAGQSQTPLPAKGRFDEMAREP